jgi:uncharacterized metal-binding protein
MPSAQLLAAAPLVEPRWHTHAAYDYTFGPEVAELVAGCRDDKGLYVMDPEQQLLLDDWFGYRVDLDGDHDRLAHFEGAVVAARQDMKTGALKAAALGKIYICEQRLVVWTAHRLIAVAEAYRDIKQLIESNPDMAAELVDHHDSPGKEELEFTGGRRIIFRVRTADNVQSLAGDTVILDEGFAVRVEHLLALLPILSARPDPQVLWGSSAGVLASVALRAVRRRGRVGDARLCYAEWAAERRLCVNEWCMHAPGTPGCAMDDRDLWLQANVAITRGRKTLEVVEDMRKAFSAKPADFASQFLVWWEDPPDEDGVPISPQSWADLVDLEAQLGEPVTFALDVSPKATMACILAAGAGADGVPVVEITGRTGVLDYRAGIGWVVPRLVELAERWPGFRIWVLAGSPAEALVPAIELAGVPVDVLPAAEYPAACVWMKSQVDGSKPGAPLLRHTGQDELSRSLAMLRTRDAEVRGTFTWVRATPTADICPGVALTVALWEAQQNAGMSAYETNRLEVV